MLILRHLEAEGGPTKMNSSTTPELYTAGTCETVLRVKRELRNTFCPSFRPNSIIPTSPNTLPSSSASGMSATCTPQVQLASLALLRHNLR